MNGISVNFLVLLLNGIPQALLTVLAVHLFTGTKIAAKQYLLLSAIFAAATYLIRFLPIAIGVNTVLSLFVIIFEFQFAYRTQLSKLIHTIASATGTFILIALSEVLNMLLLSAIFGQNNASAFLNSSNGLIQGFSTIPINLFFGIFIVIVYQILKQFEKRTDQNGKTGTETGR